MPHNATYKVVYNNCHGGFKLSPKGEKLLVEYAGTNTDIKHTRHSVHLIRVVEKLKSAASNAGSDLQITTVSGKYYIDEYDGFETVCLD